MRQLTDAARKNMARAAVHISERTREPLPTEIYEIAGEQAPTLRKTWWRTKTTG